MGETKGKEGEQMRENEKARDHVRVCNGSENNENT